MGSKNEMETEAFLGTIRIEGMLKGVRRPIQHFLVQSMNFFQDALNNTNDAFHVFP